MRVADWLFVSEEVAVKAGATHDGYLFGVPVWIESNDSDPGLPAMAAKFTPAEWWITVCLFVAERLIDAGLIDGIPYYRRDDLAPDQA
jgi:hypothetical protein